MPIIRRLVSMALFAAILMSACAPAVETAPPTPTSPLDPAGSPTLPATSTPPPAPTARPTFTPRPTATPVDTNAAVGLYFEGSQLVDLLALSKARCVQYLYSYYPGKIAEVMAEKGLSQPEAVNDICTMPVTECANIPSPYGRIPILGLGEAWAPGLSSSRFAGSYQNVPKDEFVPGVEYCFMDLGQYLLMDSKGDALTAERPSLCPDSSRTGIPSIEEDCWFAAFTIPFEGEPATYSGQFTGDYYILDHVPPEEWEYTLQDSISSTIGQFADWDIHKVWSIYGTNPGQRVIYFEIPHDPYLLPLGWDPIWVEVAP